MPWKTLNKKKHQGRLQAIVAIISITVVIGGLIVWLTPWMWIESVLDKHQVVCYNYKARPFSTTIGDSSVKVSNDAAREQWRTNGTRSDDPALAEQLLNSAEAWAEAMEPALDQGTDIADIAVETFHSTVPISVVAFLDHGNDYMVDYLEACWEHGSALRTWYETARHVERRAEDER